MRLFVCSPFAPRGGRTIDDNIALARRLCTAAIRDGHAPFAPHLLYPQMLDDAIPGDRELGLEAGHRWLLVAHQVWVCSTFGVSSGMTREIDFALSAGVPVLYDPQQFKGALSPAVTLDG